MTHEEVNELARELAEKYQLKRIWVVAAIIKRALAEVNGAHAGALREIIRVHEAGHGSTADCAAYARGALRSPQRETCWLIERGQQEGVTPPRWYRVEHPQGRWTTDANEATKFATFTEAQRGIDENSLVYCRPLEHSWL